MRQNYCAGGGGGGGEAREREKGWEKGVCVLYGRFSPFQISSHIKCVSEVLRYSNCVVIRGKYVIRDRTSAVM